MNTIDLLATIGSDASLRHASPEALGASLAQANASPSLLSAVATGDIAGLSADLGQGNMQVMQQTQWVGDGDETNGLH